MTDQPADPGAYRRALDAMYDTLALGGVGVISEANRGAEVRVMRTLMQRHPAEAKAYLASLEDLRGGKRWIDRTESGDGG